MDTSVVYERVNVLIATVYGPGGRAEVRFLVQPEGKWFKGFSAFCVRLETKRFEIDYCNCKANDTVFGLGSDEHLSLEAALELAREKVSAPLAACV